MDKYIVPEFISEDIFRILGKTNNVYKQSTDYKCWEMKNLNILHTTALYVECTETGITNPDPQLYSSSCTGGCTDSCIY